MMGATQMGGRSAGSSAPLSRSLSLSYTSVSTGLGQGSPQGSEPRESEASKAERPLKGRFPAPTRGLVRRPAGSQI